MIPFLYLGYKYDRPTHNWGDQYFFYDLMKDYLDVKENLKGLEGAVISFEANENLAYVEELNADIAKLKWVMIIITCNENGNDAFKMIRHPNKKIWLQTPHMENEADYFMPFGYPSEVKVKPKNRIYDWAFMGNDGHIRRHQAIEKMRKMHNGYLLTTNQFGSGLERNNYLDIMSQSKFIPCPGGPVTPDTFRIWEALECGCIPIVDSQSGIVPFGVGYWEKIFGDVLFPIIHDWNSLEDVIKDVDWETEQPKIMEWWKNKKQKIREDFLQQFNYLQNKNA